MGHQGPAEVKQAPPTRCVAVATSPSGLYACLSDQVVASLSPQVYPLIDFPLREISLASQRGIAQHSAALASRARVLQQVSRAGAGALGRQDFRGQPGALRALSLCHIREEMRCSCCWGLLAEDGREGG